MLVSKSKIGRIVCLTGMILTLDVLFCSNSFFTQAKTAKNQKKSYQGLPSNRRDGGSRGNCIADGKDFIAIVPELPVNVAASVSSRIFFYVPSTKKPKTIEFIIRTKEDRLVHETFIQTTGQAGIMSLPIPEIIPENSEKSHGDYHWYLSMICDKNQRARDVVLEGWIEYVKLNNKVREKINTSTSAEKFNLLQQEGIWYDAISVLAESQKSQSNSIAVQTEWSHILESIGLGELASEPLIEAKTINNFYPKPLKEY